MKPAFFFFKSTQSQPHWNQPALTCKYKECVVTSFLTLAKALKCRTVQQISHPLNQSDDIFFLMITQIVGNECLLALVMLWADRFLLHICQACRVRP